ncbi:MAG: glycosyltransferase family 4 protein [Thermoflexales bacterium]|nr:glycosyltransferase family 4 protein [Thermoflexales bacterium]
MRILELIFSFQAGSKAGGILRFSADLGKALMQRGFEIHLGALFDFGSTVEKEKVVELKNQGLDVFCAALWNKRFPHFSFYQAIKALWSWQSCNKAHIVHSHSEFSDIAALVLKLHPTRPFIIRTVHYGFHKEWRRKPWRRMVFTNFLYPLLFDLEIGVSQTITSRLNSRFLSNVLKRSALCIYNAIDLERFRNQVNRDSKRESLNIPPDVPLVGTVGRLTEQKGYFYLIEAIPLVLKENPDVHFLIVGDGELSENLKQLAASRGITHRTIFAGARPDVEEILPCLDLFVSSSLWEGLPTVILESMAANIPIVATDIPGTRELIRDGHNGWLVPPRDAYALARAILEALKNKHLCEIFARRSSEVVLQFSIDSIAMQYERLFLSLLNSQSTSIIFPKG